MKSKPTYECPICGYVVRISSKEDLILQQKEHSKNCEGKFELAKGSCLVTSFNNLVLNNHWFFCYSLFPGKIKGQDFIHSWNETKGYLQDQNGQTIIVPKNLKDKKIEDFVFDFSDRREMQAMEKEKYYDIYKIKESSVKRLNLKQVLKLMLDSLNEGKDLWSWVESKN